MKKVSKFLSALARINQTITYTDDSSLFVTARNIPIVYVMKNNDNEFKIHYLYSVAETIDRFEKHPEKFKEEFKTIFSMWGENQTIPTHLFEKSLKQHLDFITRYRSQKMIDLITKRTKVVSKEELFDVLVGEFKYSPASFEKLYGEIKEKTTGRLQEVKHKNWIIFYDTKTKSSIENVILLLDDVGAKLGSHNRLAYGKIYVVNTLPGTTLADYDISNDLIRISFKQLRSVNHDVIDSFIHELGHRNWFKNLTDNQKKEIRITFDDKKRKTDSVNVGDIVVDKENGNKYKVLSLKYLRKLIYISKLIELGTDVKRKYTLGADYQIPSEMMGTGFVLINSNNENSSFFPSIYSTRNYEEFYAELFSNWINKKLKESAKSWMENLHKDGV